MLHGFYSFLTTQPDCRAVASPATAKNFAEVGPKIRKLSRLTYCGIKDRIYFGTSASKGINSFLLVFHPKNVSEAGRWKGVLN